MPSVDELLDAAEVAEATLTETNDKIEIDADTRTMIIPDTERIFGVMSDEKGERKYFRCKRFVGNGIDLSKLSLRIIFQNASGLDTGRDKYVVTDLATDGEDYVTFSWELSRKVTAYKGIISFIVCAIKTKSDGTITNEWNTTIANGFVLDGLEANGTQEQEEVAKDYYNQLEAELLKVANEQKTEIEKKAQEVIGTIPSDYTQMQKDVDKLNEDIGNLNKEKLDSDVVYEVGDDGEAVSSTKMMDISGNGEIAKISADSVYKDNIIPLPNIAEKTVNGLTYSVKDGIVSVNGTATTYTLIDLGVNLSMMDGLSAIGYKIFILDGTHPSGMSIVLGLSLGGYAQTLTNTVQEKKSSSLITFNNKNIGVSINNSTTINVKFGVVVIPINDIPSKFNVGKKYVGYMLNQLICTNNMWAFGTNISKIKLAQYYRFRKNKLYGKSLFVAGDSVAFGFGSGGKSYADIIAEKNKMSMKKVAVSGTTFAKRNGMTNSILEQVQMMDKLYDYVLIEGGFNDYFQKDKGVSIGTMPKNMNSSRDDKTTYGALDSICLWLKQNYPSSKILFVVPHKIMTIAGVIDNGFYPYLQAIRDVCEKYSISYADIALKGGCTPFYQEFRDTYFSGDGIHPNLEGYESFYVPRIEAEMEMI